MSNTISPDEKDKVRFELSELDHELVEVDGQWLRPSQCYHYETDPAHLLFNTNCPEKLKTRILGILEKYLPGNESSSQE